MLRCNNEAPQSAFALPVVTPDKRELVISHTTTPFHFTNLLLCWQVAPFEETPVRRPRNMDPRIAANFSTRRF
jgi:hypothetical protein